jgi:hypothetical protein
LLACLKIPNFFIRIPPKKNPLKKTYYYWGDKAMPPQPKKKRPKKNYERKINNINYIDNKF